MRAMVMNLRCAQTVIQRHRSWTKIVSSLTIALANSHVARAAGSRSPTN
jgi:hypothetical protein